MGKRTKILRNLHDAFSKGGIAYLLSRIPSIMFWSVISTGLIIGAQYLYFTVMPGNYFLRYDEGAKIHDVSVGETPVLHYCREARDAYQVTVYAQIRKVEPPVFTQRYELNTTIPAGYNCTDREIAQRPALPGDYKIFYTTELNLPFGIKKYVEWETGPFKVGLPINLYSNYQLTVQERDEVVDGMPVYKPGSDLQYKFTATLLATTFGTLERHIVCKNQDYLIDIQSGRTTAGEKDTVDRTLTLPKEALGVCHLEKRYTLTVEGSTDTITQTLRSNTFTVQ